MLRFRLSACIALIVASPYVASGLKTRWSILSKHDLEGDEVEEYSAAQALTMKNPYSDRTDRCVDQCHDDNEAANPFLDLNRYMGSDMIRLWPHGDRSKAGNLPKMGEGGQARKKTRRIENACRNPWAGQQNGEKSDEIYITTMPHIKPYLLSVNDTKRSDATMIIVPGGHFLSLAWEREGTSVAEWLNSIGINAFVLRHRVPTTREEALKDVERAMSFVRSRAEMFSIDPSKVGIIGFASGGSLVQDISVSVSRAYEKADLSDDTDYHPDFAMMIYSDGPALPRNEDGGAMGNYRLHFDQHMPPPTFSVSILSNYCMYDSHAHTVHDYCAAVRRDAAQECRDIEYSNGGQGFGTCALTKNFADDGCKWTSDAEIWLRKQGFLQN